MTFPFVIHAAAFSADGQRIFCASGEGSVICLDAKTGRTVFTLRGHAGPVYRLILTPAGKQIVTGSADGTIRVWPVVNPEFTEVAHGMPSIDALAFAPDGARLAYSHHAAVSSRRQTATVRLDSIPPADNAVELKLARKLNALAVSPDRGMLATADDEALRLWDLTKAEVRCTIPERAVTGISVSADGQWLATATRNPDVELRPDISLLPAPIVIGQPAAPKPVPAIKIWRSSDGQLERILPGQISVDFSPNGKRIAGAHDGVVKIWDTATGEEVLSLIGPTDPVLKVQFVAGGRKVIGFTQRQAILWDADTGQSMATVNGIRGPAAATPDGRRIVSLHGGLVKWWDAQLGRELLSLAAPEVSFNQLAVSAGGHHIAAAGRNKLVVWQGAWQSRFNAATP
jgi:WD40 repeat protein